MRLLDCTACMLFYHGEVGGGETDSMMFDAKEAHGSKHTPKALAWPTAMSHIVAMADIKSVCLDCDSNIVRRPPSCVKVFPHKFVLCTYGLFRGRDYAIVYLSSSIFWLTWGCSRIQLTPTRLELGRREFGGLANQRC